MMVNLERLEKAGIETDELRAVGYAGKVLEG